MADSSRSISIVVINGSVRPGNYSAMAPAIVVDELRKHPKVSVEVVDPAKFKLPFPGTDRDGHVLEPAVEQTVRRVATGLMNDIEKHVCPAVTLERMLREAAANPDIVTV